MSSLSLHKLICHIREFSITLLHLKRPKLNGVLAVLSAIGLTNTTDPEYVSLIIRDVIAFLHSTIAGLLVSN